MINRSVAQQRNIPKEGLDDFPTPPWATRALFEHVLHHVHYGRDYKHSLKSMSVWEPAANRGYMAKVLKEYCNTVYTSDIADYDYRDINCIGWDFAKGEFADDVDGLGGHADEAWPPQAEAIITNPPFNKAEAFIERALTTPSVKIIAMFTRASFLESKGRYEKLFKYTPPSVYAPFVERVSLREGRIDRNSSSFVAYAWIVWNKESFAPTRVVWIPPCKRDLEKESDYER